MMNLKKKGPKQRARKVLLSDDEGPAAPAADFEAEMKRKRQKVAEAVDQQPEVEAEEVQEKEEVRGKDVREKEPEGSRYLDGIKAALERRKGEQRKVAQARLASEVDNGAVVVNTRDLPKSRLLRSAIEAYRQRYWLRHLSREEFIALDI